MTAHPSRPTLGLLFDALEHEHPRELWRGWLDFASENDCHALGFLGGYLPSMCAVEGLEAPDPRNFIHRLPGRENVQGLAIRLGALSREGGEAEDLCAKFPGLPLVSVGFAVPGVPTVTEDAAQGIFAAVGHLVKAHGFRRLAYLRGPDGNPFAEARFEAFARAVEGHGLAVDPRLVTPGDDWSHAAGARAMGFLLDDRRVTFDAVLAANDRLALGAIEVLKAHGLKVPGDVGVIGFDNLDESRFCFPSLTTIQYPSYQLGRRAAEVLLGQIRGQSAPPATGVAASLVIRQSCGCLPESVARAGHGRASPVSLESAKAAWVSAVGAPAWAGGLWDSLVRELDQGTPEFLLHWSETLNRSGAETEDLATWENVLSQLRQFHPLGDRNRADRAENLWHQARVLTAQRASDREEARRSADREASRRFLGSVARLSAPSGAEAARTVIEEGMSLSIGHWWVVACDDPGQGLARVLGRQRDLFPSRQLIPQGLDEAERWALVVEPLAVGNRVAGYLVIDADAPLRWPMAALLAPIARMVAEDSP